VRNKIIGIMRLLTDEYRNFSQDEIDFSVALAEQGGMAIENARMYERLRKQSREIQEGHLSNKKGCVSTAFFVYCLTEKLESERFYKEQDQRNNQRIDRKGLDHGQTNDQSGRDLTGCARVPCYTLSCPFKTKTLADAGTQCCDSDCETKASAAIP